MALKSRVIDDVARVAGGGIGILSQAKDQIKQEIRSALDDMAYRLDYVAKDDFERLESLVHALEERVRELENSKTKKAAKK